MRGALSETTQTMNKLCGPLHCNFEPIMLDHMNKCADSRFYIYLVTYTFYYCYDNGLKRASKQGIDILILADGKFCNQKRIYLFIFPVVKMYCINGIINHRYLLSKVPVS